MSLATKVPQTLITPTPLSHCSCKRCQVSVSDYSQNPREAGHLKGPWLGFGNSEFPKKGLKKVACAIHTVLNFLEVWLLNNSET
jgi:hypothetical protein